MKKVSLLFLVSILAFTLAACPMCNIHNYLDGSVHMARCIYKAKIVGTFKTNRNNGAIVQVLEIIQAERQLDTLKVLEKDSSYTYKIIPQVKVGMLDSVWGIYEAKEHIGDTFLLFPPSYKKLFQGGHGPTYDYLKYEHASEVELKYIISNDTVISSADQAVTLLEGISWNTVSYAHNYCKAHYEDCQNLLINRIKYYRVQQFNNPKNWYVKHRIKNLVAALMLNLNEKTKSFVLQEIDSILAKEYEMPKEDAQRIDLGDEATYLQTIVRKTSADVKFQTQVKSKLVQALGSSTGTKSMLIVYALQEEKLTKLQLTNLSDIQRYYVALGYCCLAQHEKDWWQFDRVTAYCELAKDASKDERIKIRIEKLAPVKTSKPKKKKYKPLKKKATDFIKD